MAHGGDGPQGVLMLRPDGTPMTKREVIKRRRGAFKWLPVLCSNDLVHGSWWFVWGSIITAIFAIVPLAQNYESFYHQHDDLLPQADFEATWGLLVFSGTMYSIGSLAFVRAFEEPPKVALFHWFRHLQTDELLGAWLFLFGTLPAIPYSFLYLITIPNATNFGNLAMAFIFNIGTGLFVVACYPSDKKGGPKKNYALPCCIWMVGARLWIIKHLANDWLAGTWFFLWANIFVTVGSIFLLFVALVVAAEEQIFIWLSGSVASVLFLIGSLYFVAGSYPHATQFYYAVDRGQTDTLTYKPPANLPDYSCADDADPSLLEDIFFIGKARDHNMGFVVTPGNDLQSTEGEIMGERDGVQLESASNPLHGFSSSGKGYAVSSGGIAAAGGGGPSTGLLGFGLGVRKDLSLGLTLNPSATKTNMSLASSSGAVVPTTGGLRSPSGKSTTSSSGGGGVAGAAGGGGGGYKKSNSSNSLAGAEDGEGGGGIGGGVSSSSSQLNSMREKLAMLLTADEDENRDDDDDDVEDSKQALSTSQSHQQQSGQQSSSERSLPAVVGDSVGAGLSKSSSLKEDDDIE